MESMPQALAVLLVLALLGGTLWWLRRKGVAQFALNRAAAGKRKSIQVVERLALTPQHSLHLVKLEDRTMLIAASPGGCSILSERVETR
jgi:flagellar biogenesis protein FliO